ncbi:VP3 [Kummerowia striata gokushovirus]|nr:VP3 [Kummerowia striata gokushovirus]
MSLPKFQSAYDHLAPHTFGFVTVGESMTQQQFKEEANVNTIMAKYRKTGMITYLSKHNPSFGDFENPMEYHDGLNRIAKAQQDFDGLSAEVRAKFSNDPGKLIEFLADDKNYDEALKLGLVNERKAPEPTMREHFEQALENNDKKRKANKPDQK